MSTTTLDQIFGREVPPEVLNPIFKLILDDDTTAYLDPSPTAAVVQRVQPKKKRSKKTTEFAVTSLSPLMQTCKPSRELYYPMFRKKALNMDIDRLIVIVQDFHFNFLTKEPLSSVRANRDQAMDKFMDWEFPVRLAFTEEFLQTPNTDNIEQFLYEECDDDPGASRNWSFYFTINRLPRRYVEPFTYMLNGLVIMRQDDLGPELQTLLDDIRPRFQSGSIMKD